mmetsp:Transcript_33416/g.110082  ORF Transcript_33416/g.110082 Transcript_33416/m.110082 type:complete len:229 (+) Transcript_33416:602-1288(+)
MRMRHVRATPRTWSAIGSLRPSNRSTCNPLTRGSRALASRASWGSFRGYLGRERREDLSVGHCTLSRLSQTKRSAYGFRPRTDCATRTRETPGEWCVPRAPAFGLAQDMCFVFYPCMHKTIPSQLTLLRCCSSLARRWWQAALQPQQPSSGRTEALEDGLNSTREPAAGGASSGNGAVVGAPPVSRNLAARRPVLAAGQRAWRSAGEEVHRRVAALRPGVRGEVRLAE